MKTPCIDHGERISKNEQRLVDFKETLDEVKKLVQSNSWKLIMATGILAGLQLSAPLWWGTIVNAFN